MAKIIAIAGDDPSSTGTARKVGWVLIALTVALILWGALRERKAD